MTPSLRERRTRGLSRLRRAGALVLVAALALLHLAIMAPPAAAQDIDVIVSELEDDGFYIEPGGDGTSSDFRALVSETSGADDEWYFVSMAGPVDPDFADTLRERVRPTGNVIVYFFDNEDFLNVQLASDESESIEERALISFDSDDWITPDEFMDDVVRDFDRITVTTSSGSTTSGSTSSGSTSGGTTGSGSTTSSDGGGSVWPWFVGIGAAVGGGVWWSGRRKKQKAAEDQLEAAEKIRAELQTELDELANDVIVLSGPVDLSENETAINHYREATATYTSISDEIPDLDELANADLRELSELGARVVQARWQMDAAEAIIGGDPVPEKPQVEPPPPPPEQAKAPAPAPRIPPQIQQRQPRPRTPYSRSRRSSGGGLLDILIAGSGMLGPRRRGGTFGGSTRGRSSGGMFGGGSSYGSGRSRSSQSRSPRPGGGVFGGGSSSRSRGSSRRSTSRSRTRRGSSSSRRSRSSSSRRSSSRRRRR